MMLPLWFTGELFSVLFFNFGPVAYWAHVGGFAGGMALAVVFKLTNFEQRILGREPEIEKKPEKAPIVAFQKHENKGHGNALATGGPKPVSADKPLVSPIVTGASFQRLKPMEILLKAIGKEHLEATTTGGKPVRLTQNDVSAVAIGRIDLVEPGLADQVFSKGVPREPAYILALLTVRDKQSKSIEIPSYFIDGQKCRWPRLLENPHPQVSKNMVAFTTLLLRIFSKATYIHGKGPLGPNNMPIYENLDSFIQHIRKTAARIGL
jgi:hypothetical protein